MSFESLLGGSHVAFKKRERPPLTESERKLQVENNIKLGEGVRVLRKLRTGALEEQHPDLRQNLLTEAHQLSTQMAEEILRQASHDQPIEIDPNFLAELQRKQDTHAERNAGSGHGTPTINTASNLIKAADDMLVRIEEKAHSFKTPDHKLTREEMEYVIFEFLIGVNTLTVDARHKFFEPGTKVGGILTGGSVYVELVKKIVAQYGDPSLNVDSFVIAVDKESKRTVVEANEPDTITQTVILADDVIDRGGTVVTALWATGKQFPKARIYSGQGTDEPGGFEERRVEKHTNHLALLFENFFDLSDAKRFDEALNIFQQAEKYAQDNNVTLQPGWYKRKRQIDKKIKSK